MKNIPAQVQQQREVKEWEDYIVEGMEAREDKDNSQWKLGDLAAQITVDYGENSIGKFACAISVVKKTLMNYRTVASTFEKPVRKKYRKLSFSHFAILSSVEKPEAWLEQADDNEWSVETLRKEVKEAYDELKPPNLEDEKPEVYRCPECGKWRLKDISVFEICQGHYVIEGNKTVFK